MGHVAKSVQKACRTLSARYASMGINIEGVLRHVEKQTGVRRAEFMAQCRRGECIEARNLAIVQLHTRVDWNMARIGRVFGLHRSVVSRILQKSQGGIKK